MKKKLRPLRWFNWQIAGFQKFRDAVGAKKVDFLCVVSGGRGKTLFALECARQVLATNQIDRVIIATFTSHLIRQWDAWSTAMGINLLAVHGNGKLKVGLPGDVVGYICTYAAMGRMADLHAAFTGECRTLVIFDEIHHLGDPDERGRSLWGKQAKVAFSAANYRLALSGTPFRSNAERIPFVTYKPVEGSNTVSELVADHSYCYGRAVADQVCRRVQFRGVDGPIEWERADMPGVRFQRHFADQIDERYFGDRLRFAVSAEMNGEESNNLLLAKMFVQANNQLADIRKAGHADAAGLIVASSVAEARQMKLLLQRVTGHRAIIVHNEEERALKMIEDFAEGIAPWIIAVRMISEGVDIPRLRVCCYATTVTEELFVMQVLFRIVRRPEGSCGESYFFYPADPRLRAIAEKVEEEIKVEIDARGREAREGGEIIRVEKTFVHADADHWDATIAGNVYSEDDIAIAEAFRSQRGDLHRVDIIDLVKFYHDYRRYEQTRQQSPFEDFAESYNERRDRLRREIQDAVGRLHHRMGKQHNEIHLHLNGAVAVRDKDSATIEQLEKMLHIANEFEAEFANGVHDNYDYDDVEVDV